MKDELYEKIKIVNFPQTDRAYSWIGKGFDDRQPYIYNAYELIAVAAATTFDTGNNLMTPEFCRYFSVEAIRYNLYLEDVAENIVSMNSVSVTASVYFGLNENLTNLNFFRSTAPVADVPTFQTTFQNGNGSAGSFMYFKNLVLKYNNVSVWRMRGATTAITGNLFCWFTMQGWYWK